MVGQAPWFPPIKFDQEVIQTLIPWNNMTNKLIYNEILALIDVEFQWIADLELDSYFIPDSIQPSMEARLNNSSNQVIRKQWMDFIAIMCSEFREIEDKGYGYTVRDDLELDLKRAMGNIPNITHKNAIYNVIDIYLREFALMEIAF